MLHYKLPKASRGTSSRRLVTNHGTILIPAKQPDVIFEHNGNEAPYVQDVDSNGFVINQFDIQFAKITIVGEVPTSPLINPKECPTLAEVLGPNGLCSGEKLSVEQKTIISQSVAPLVIPKDEAADATFE